MKETKYIEEYLTNRKYYGWQFICRFYNELISYKKEFKFHKDYYPIYLAIVVFFTLRKLAKNKSQLDEYLERFYQDLDNYYEYVSRP